MLFLSIWMIMAISCSSPKPDYSAWKTTIGYVYKMWEVDGSEISYKYQVNGNT